MQPMAETTLEANPMNGVEDERGETIQEHMNEGEIGIDTTNTCVGRDNEGDDDNIVMDDKRGVQPTK